MGAIWSCSICSVVSRRETAFSKPTVALHSFRFIQFLSFLPASSFIYSSSSCIYHFLHFLFYLIFLLPLLFIPSLILFMSSFSPLYFIFTFTFFPNRSFLSCWYWLNFILTQGHNNEAPLYYQSHGVLLLYEASETHSSHWPALTEFESNFPPCNPLPTDETLLDFDYSITMVKAHMSYIP